ncbi:WD repeat-containing protein 43 [Hordeum vulgare]|nr:WD repeat-containing protein 43 [Hordeum vulgare]
MASVIPDVGGGDIVGGDIVGNDSGNDGVGSFHEVDNWLGSTSYETQEGWQQPEAPLIQSSPAPGCSMGCSLADKKWYMNTQESCIVKDSEVQKNINDRKAQLERSRIQRESDLNHFEGDTEVSEFCSDNSVHSDGSAGEAVQMEIDSASEDDRPLELTALVKYVKNPGPTSRCHNDVEQKQKPDWFPEPDEFCFAGDLGISDEEEEDEVDLPYLLNKPKIENTKVTTKWLAKAVEPSLRADPRAHVDALIKNSKINFSVDVSRSVEYRARRKAIKVVQGDQKEQYYRLRDYLQAIIDTNPRSRCIVTTFEDPENPPPIPRFKYMFYCLHASKQGFLNGCRPFIATGRDGNNNIYPIAFGVVIKEDGDSWTWFLTQLRCCIGSGSKSGTYTIISDRQKGLLKAINEVFPDSPHRYCLRHIYAIFQSAGFRATELKKIVDQARYSFTKHGHELGMTLLEAQCEGAWKWLEKIPKETWCTYAMDYNCKTDLVVNNLSEVFNKMIIDVRAKPIRTMFEGIRTKQMIKRQKTRENIEYSRWMITPNYSEKLEENKKYAKYSEAHRAGPDIWQVSSGEKQYSVNLATKSCD